MATFNNGESLSSVRTKINAAIDKIDGNATISNDLTADGLNLAAISDTIEDTAVDIFVYDTRKDSDGGAWRKRTQHTSWYNETLNTSTRGSRKEFPAVAVIVAESNQVTIYDGDDPDLPMWMVFETNTTLVSRSNATMLSAYYNGGGMTPSMLNGVFTITGKYSYHDGLTVINFISEAARLHSSGGTYYSPKSISLRNELNHYITSVTGDMPIANNNCNDVAMTVLPNAPIDAATGLPVPTIAVATDGGVSVIKDDGTVVDIVHSDSAFTPSIRLDGNTVAYDANNFLHARKIPSADVSAGVRYAAHSDDIWFAPRFYYPSVYSLGNFDLHPTGGQVYDLIQKDNDVSVANSDRLILAALSGNQERVANDASYAWITSSYNTGWMNGDIKLATLSDTDDTNVTGSELVTNGTFDTDTTGWTISGTGASFAVSSGQLVITRNGTSAVARQTITTEVGKTYVLTCDLVATTGGAKIGLELGSSSGELNNTLKTYSVTHVATSTSTTIDINTYNTTSGTLTVDNVTCRLAEDDRCVHGKGLQVFGTVTKSAVATGADLVAYSGFSASNYLEQPYNSDLDFGTGDYCAMGWIKLSSAPAGNVRIFRRAYHTGSAYSGSSISLEVLGGTGYLYSNVTDDSYASFDYVQSTSSVAGIGWAHVAVVRSGNTLSLYVNGKYNNSTTMTAALGSLDNTNAVLTVSNDPTHSSSTAFTGSLALFRISATAPSPEQIKKIYEDEKVLFQENAQATLYGSSDAVTALAYDDSTNLLHVGTSAGRSVFQGLRRVDNTTTAVSAAISASNNLVGEQ